MITAALGECIPVVFALGIMSLLAILFGVLKRTIESPWLCAVAQGIAFGLGAIFSMMQPVPFGDGISVDGRAIIVGLAAGFGGRTAGLIAAAMAAGYRIDVGGPYAPYGTSIILVAAAMGSVWTSRRTPQAAIRPRALVLLGLMISLSYGAIVLLPRDIMMQMLVSVVPFMTAGAVLGSILMGVMIERERRYILTESRLRRDAHTDPLTGIPNRRSFFASMERAILRGGPEARHALLIVDIDHFKCVNDRYGHSGGDDALKFVAAALADLAGPHDRVCRLGGEEFAVFLNTDSFARAGRIAETLRHRICTTAVPVGNQLASLSVSVGVALRHRGENETVAELFHEADTALYRAKAGGRNLVIFADEPSGRADAVPQGPVRIPKRRRTRRDAAAPVPSPA